MNKKTIKLNSIIFFAVFAVVLLMTVVFWSSKVEASCTSPSSTGNYMVSTNCAFSQTVNGVEKGNLTVNSGTTLTINANQTIVFNSGYSIVVNGSISISNTSAQIKKTKLWMIDKDVDGFMHEALFKTVTNVSFDLNDHIGMVLKCGEMNIKVMELLDKAHTGKFGNPVPVEVETGTKKGPGILITGHDLLDLYELLKQTEGTGINIYTHGEMLPAHGYPELKKFKHLVANYGNAWQDQKKEFDSFPGAILMTTNCIQKPLDSYKGRIFTTGLVRWPGVENINADGKKKDFTKVIEKAIQEGGFSEDRKDKDITSIFDLNDFIGLRIILLFLPDVSKACDLLANTFNVFEIENTADRLGDSRFGYQSTHLQLSLPESWRNIPTFNGCEGLSAEIQVRTVAQHIWAEASRKLNYKSENAVPLPVRRALNRVAALLEIVDSELERTLNAKRDYSTLQEIDDSNSQLNVHLLQRLLTELLGSDRWVENQPYGELLSELSLRSIVTVGQLRALVYGNKEEAVYEDDMVVKMLSEKGTTVDGELVYEEDGHHITGNLDLINKGIFKSQVGLVRGMLLHIQKDQ